MGAPADRMDVILADITTLSVDAIVNAANSSLLGGGGVDGAIHRAAGPRLLQACRALNGCKTGEAKITPGFELPARCVIHAVGPLWSGGSRSEADLLAACYRRSLEIAAEHDLHTIAFPAISTGVYRYPPQQAARIAVSTVAQFLSGSALPDTVTFCCFSEASAALHRDAIRTLEGVSHD